MSARAGRAERRADVDGLTLAVGGRPGRSARSDVLPEKLCRRVAQVVIHEHQFPAREGEAWHHLMPERLVGRSHRRREGHRVRGGRYPDARVAVDRTRSAGGESTLGPPDIDPAAAVDRHRRVRVGPEAEWRGPLIGIRDGRDHRPAAPASCDARRFSRAPPTAIPFPKTPAPCLAARTCRRRPANGRSSRRRRLAAWDSQSGATRRRHRRLADRWR